VAEGPRWVKPGKGLFVGGVKLPLALAELRLRAGRRRAASILRAGALFPPDLFDQSRYAARRQRRSRRSSALAVGNFSLLRLKPSVAFTPKGGGGNGRSVGDCFRGVISSLPCARDRHPDGPQSCEAGAWGQSLEPSPSGCAGTQCSKTFNASTTRESRPARLPTQGRANGTVFLLHRPGTARSRGHSFSRRSDS
jgi:hypothetical protein